MNILHLYAATVLEAEIDRSFASLGHKVVKLDVQGMASRLSLEEVAGLVRKNRIELVFTVNYQGFDSNGVLAEYFDRISLPIASWEIDHPYYMDILGLRRKEPHENLFQFIWDEGYLADMEDLGFKRVYYLPLGVDRSFYSAEPLREKTIDYPVLFVGTSLKEFFVTLRDRLLGFDYAKVNPLGRLIEQVFSEHCHDTSRPVIELLRERQAEYDGIFSDRRERLRFEFFVEIYLSMRYREYIIGRLKKVHVFGDSGWHGIIPRMFFHGKINYGTDLVDLYRRSGLVINCTLPKNRWDGNQRIFDVYACGTLVLTDRRRNLNRFFEADQLLVYDNIEMLVEMIDYYQDHQAERHSLIERGRQRVIAENRLEFRLAELIEKVLDE